MPGSAIDGNNGAMTAREALGWLRREFDRTLDSARQRLNAFAEAPDRPDLLADFCRELHQIAGALAISGLESGRVLAEHVEALAQDIGAGHRAADAEHLEPLMRATLELSDYFDRLAAGLPDAASALLPTTNEIRALLDESPLEREHLGRPTPAPRATPADLTGLAGELRPRYQAALLAYYRGAYERPALAQMKEILGELERAASNPAVFELLWVTGGILEALEDGGLSPTLSVKRLLGHVERELKRLEKTSEETLAEHPPRALLQELLTQIGRARSRGERVTAIRSNFRLGEETGGEEVEIEAKTAAGSALMRSVGGAILEDLERVRDRIDLFVRTGHKDPEALAPLGSVLKKVADALGMLGLDGAQSRVEQEREGILQLSRGDGSDQPALLRLATELIGIESEVETFLLGSGGDPQSAAARAARSSGLRETLAEVARIKDTVTEYLRYGGRPQELAALPTRADRVARVLDFMELAEPASLIRRIASFLERLPGLEAGSGTDALDRLADAVVSVEYYLETLASGREPRASMLGNADRALAALGVGVEEGTLEASRRHVPPVPREVEPEAFPPALELAPVRGHSADSSIAEIFVEEVPEVSAALASAYERWRTNPADRETLATVRRGFQTLKGSGRMAGAERLSAFARTFEELLDRVLDLALPADRDTIAVVGEAIEALQALLGEFSHGVDAKLDVAALMQRAAGLGRVADTELSLGVGAGEPAPQQTPISGEGPVEVPGETESRIPAPLYDIYRGEALEHLAVLESWCTDLDDGGERIITPALQRAVHTLVGSARMAGASEMDGLMKPLEEALDRAIASGPEPETFVEPIAEAARVGGELVQAYGDETRLFPDWESARERMCELRDSLPAVVAEESPRVEEGETLEPTAVVAEEGAAGEREEIVDGTFDLAAQPNYDAELVQLFASEAAELLEGVDTALGVWRKDGQLAEPLTDLLRRLHTLKGGARMAGITPFADLVHDLESFLTRVSEGDVAPSSEYRELTERAFDRLHRMLEHVGGDNQVPFTLALRNALQRAIGIAPSSPVAEHAKEEEIGPAPGSVPDVTPEEPAEAAPASVETASEAPGPSAGTPAPPAAPAGQRAEAVRQRYRRMGLARVRADLLEAAINGAGEVGIYRGRLEQQIVTMNLHLAELERTVERVRNQLRELEIETEAQILSRHQGQDVKHLAEFDPLEFDRYTRIQELSRSLAEAVSDLLSLRALFATELHQAEASLERQGRVNAELQDALLRTRMMPFALSESRLRRVVRQVGEEMGKEVQLRLFGMEGEMDRQILEHVLPALEHLLRNAVVHGIEAAAVRRMRGKPDQGTIDLTLRREGAETVIEVTDDGGGLDFAAIRARGEIEGLIAADAALSDQELSDLVFRPGFSTADVLSQTAGRGVGMDVVATEVRHAGGTIELNSIPGRSLQVTLRLPSGIAITHALIVRIGQKRYSVPLASIEGISRVSRDELKRLLEAENPSYEFGGRNYELASLHEALDEEPVPAEEVAPRVPLLMTKAGERRAAFIVDDMEGSREIVVKPVGPQVGRIPGISGAMAFGDGSIGLLLDLPGLVRAMPRLEATLEAARVETLTAEPLVMVVDDSITVRRVTERMLIRHNVRVMTAKDGIEALEQLEDYTPDLMLLDIEMPRMNGYELATRMKADPRLKGVPIIVITSRAGEKHRARAKEIGIERYLGKPYQESELLAAIGSVMRGFEVPASRASP